VSGSELREQILPLLHNQNKPEVAILQLNRVLKTEPKNSQALALKAYALNMFANVRKEWKYSQSALECAERALVLNPDDDLALTSRGWALIDLGRAREALPTLQKATKVNPDNEYAWFNLAWAQYLSGNPLASTDSIKRALEISPGNPTIKQGKEMMEKGMLPEHLKRRPPAA
jgi:tetratricopeptide (TPR) repeat protein